ncbi:MAG: Mu-like prophage major head subunit gpT family protein [Myxococcales bacterium]|nr:Mu-like prophage major head subunit gpT family protein [Myxococcales bacterium]
MIPNLETLLILDTQYSGAFKTGLGRATDDWQMIATQIPSQTNINTYAWLGTFPRMREWIGPRIVRGLDGKSYVLENKDWELTLGVPRKSIEDDQFGIYLPFAEQMGMEVKQHKTELVFGALPKGVTEKGYDGVPFFSANHPVGEGTKSNLIAGAGPAWYILDDTQALKSLIFQLRREPELVAKNRTDDDNMFWDKEAIWGVDGRYAVGYAFWQTILRSKATLTEDNLSAARRQMRELTDDQGRRLNIRPKLLLVPPELETTAEKLITSAVIANGESNVMQNKFRLHVSDFLDGT